MLIEGGFDAFAEASCRPYYAARMGAPSVPPGRYFRMHLVGYFEGIDSERGLEWRCSDSLSLREFLRLGSRERVPDHSWLSKTRARLPHEVHAAVFDWVLALIGEAGLVKGERIGVDASTMEANAALRNIVRRDTGEGYREMLEHLARESGIETPTAEDLAASGPQAQGQEAFQRGLGFEERPRGQDRQDEGRHDASGLQARARGGSGHRRGGGRRAAPGRRGRHDDASQNVGDGQGEPCER